jgi:hypothetical protein
MSAELLVDDLGKFISDAPQNGVRGLVVLNYGIFLILAVLE